jgi:hypothetical protein
MRFLLLFLLSITNDVTFAQDYPTRPVRMVEPFGAGGGPDVIARAVSPKLSELWGQPVTVENHPGAGSTSGPRPGREIAGRRLYVAREHQRSGVQRRAREEPTV